MSDYRYRTTLLGLLQWVMAVSLVGTALMLLIALLIWSLRGAVAQVLLTFVAMLLGSLLMQVQLRARHRSEGSVSILLSVGVAVIFISQISFLALVWTDWKTYTSIWRIWWISMVPSVFVTHLILLQRASGKGSGGMIELLTGLCVLWAGVMLLWLGLRADLFAGISPAYFWVGAAPAAGTVLGSTYLVIRRMLRHRRPRAFAKRFSVTSVLTSYLVVAVGAFYFGRATGPRTRELQQDPAALVDGAGGDLRRQLGDDKYKVQSRVATALGDTRIVSRPPLIRLEQIETIQSRLRPGDILLERRNWYLSNPWLPGFWPHAALYVGKYEDLVALGVTEHPSVREHLAAYLEPAADGRRHTVIEAVSEGVILNSLTHSMHADYVAVLRPRVTDQQRAAAVVRAFENLGKLYDFNFDFDDTSRLVCSQVVYVAYQGAVAFQTVRVLGRNTLPANEIARKYAAEAGRADRRLDFVLFLDADPKKALAFEADEASFRASVDRPRALGEKE